MAGTVINNCERPRSHAAPVINFRPSPSPCHEYHTLCPRSGPGEGFPYQRDAYPRYIDFNQARLISEAFFLFFPFLFMETNTDESSNRRRIGLHLRERMIDFSLRRACTRAYV